jgi:hypothetical protein
MTSIHILCRAPISPALPVAGALPVDSYYLMVFSLIYIRKGLQGYAAGQMFRQLA